MTGRYYHPWLQIGAASDLCHCALRLREPDRLFEQCPPLCKTPLERWGKRMHAGFSSLCLPSVMISSV